MMSTREVTAIVHTCDGCGKEVVAAVGVDPPGFHGTVVRVRLDGVKTAPQDWYACGVRCIRFGISSLARQGLLEIQGPESPA